MMNQNSADHISAFFNNDRETKMLTQQSVGILPAVSRRASARVLKAGLFAGALLCSFGAYAQVAVFQENFSAGLGGFTAAGTVNTSSGAARLEGCYGCTDGAITSGAINTVGFSNLSLSFDRVTSGLNSGEAGIAEFSINGSTWTAIESAPSGSTGLATFSLPATAAGQSALRLRFRINASLSSETYTVDNIQLVGTSGTGGTNPFAKGPNPTTTSLEANVGPFTYASTNVSSLSASGYGGGTIYHPTNVAGPFAAIAISPGYTGTKSTMSWWGERLASHGFVVITIDTNSLYDQPDSRATQLMAALRQLVTFNNTSSHAIYRKIDPNRLGVMGHSMGGGGTLIAARDNPTLKAAIPMAPWNTTTNFSGITTPTLIVACESDTVAPVSSHASPFYNSIPTAATKKGFLEMNNGDHFCVMTGNDYTRIMGKYGISWMKRFMDNDTRYSPFLCGAQHQADLSNSQISEYRENCPY